MKNLVIFILIVGGVYTYVKPSKSVKLLTGETSIPSVSSQSGIHDLHYEGGYGFDVNDLAVPGQSTIVEFYVSWCSACKKLDKSLNRFIKVRPDIVIKQIKMKDKWNVRWAKEQYGLNITGTPHVVLFNGEGKVIAQDEGKNKKALRLLYKWMNDA